MGDTRILAIYACFVCGICGSVGCQMTAPVHVWKRPTVASGGNVRVAVAPIGGDAEVAERLQEALALSRPQSMPQLSVIQPSELEQFGSIQLVSYDGQPSEMAAVGAARQAGANYLLAGHVLSHQLAAPDPGSQSKTWWSFLQKPPPPESMTVRWVVYDVPSGQRLGEHTLTIDRTDAEKHFPDLAFQAAGDAKVIAASARRSWEMVVPTTRSEEVMIDLPWFAPGSSAVRKGNAYARLGRWEMAEREWQDAADQHNWNTAAWRNLAIAAAAHEDFDLARSRLKHVDSQWLPGDESRATLHWIEEKQRDYHASFQLPAPESGWSFPDPPLPPSDPELVPNQPKSLDDQPWYTALPFIPPPGWSWSQWWSQPWVW
jgi:hypothetical protein